MAGSPLPLLGTFHEASIAVEDIRASVEFYERLGFSHATTNDILAHPYGVMTDGRLFLGLHQRRGASPVLTFVRPGVAESVRAFAAAGLALSFSRTGEHVFNEIGLLDPFGHALAVLEARTYSPPMRAPAEVSLCGDFSELSLPVADFAAAREFWEALGFVASEEVLEPYPHLPLTSDFLDVSFHPPGVCARAMLVFRDPVMRARITRLGELGLPLSPVRGAAHGVLVLESPEGTPLALIESER